MEERPARRPRPIPLPIVIARIVSVSGLGVAGALGVFLLVGGLWQIGLAALAAAAMFLFFMLVIEHEAERR